MGGMVPEEFFLSGAAGGGSGLPMMGGAAPAPQPPSPPPEPVQPVATAPMPKVDVPSVVPPPPGIFGAAGTPQLMGGPRGDTLGGFNPEYVIFHESAGPVNGQYNATVYPDGRVEYRNPSNPYGAPAGHAYQANRDSVGISYRTPVGKVGERPTPEGLASIQAEFDKARADNPSIKYGVGHGQADNLYRSGDFPYNPTRHGKSITEASYMKDLTGPTMAHTPKQAAEFARKADPYYGAPSVPTTNEPPSGQFLTANAAPPVTQRGLATVAGLAPPPVVPPQIASNAPIVGRGVSGNPPGEIGGPPPVYPEGPPSIPPPSAQPGSSAAPPTYSPPPIYAAAPEPGGIVESYTRGSPSYSQHGMGPNELPDGSFWKAQDFATGGPAGLPSWMSKPTEVASPDPEPASTGRVAESTRPPTYAQGEGRGRVSDAVASPAQYDEKMPWTPSQEGTRAKIAAPIKDPAKSEKTWTKAIGKGLEVAGKVIKEKPTPKLVQVDPPRSSGPFIGAPLPRNVDMFGRPRHYKA